MDHDHPPFAASEPPGQAAAPDPHPTDLTRADPPPARRRSRRAWLYLAAIFILGALTGESQAVDPAERWGDITGDGIALVFMSVLTVGIFYVWRRSTRPLIPGAAFIASFFLCVINSSENKRETEEQFNALQHLADSVSTPAADRPPRNDEARVLWATRKAMEDLLVHADSLARVYDVDPDNPPEEWLSPAYMADARRYPEVRTHFTRYRSFLQAYDSTMLDAITGRLRTRLLQSGLSQAQVDAFVHDGVKGATDTGERRRIKIELETVDQALEFHAYLVAVDSRVHLDEPGETAMFERDSELRHASTALERIQRLARESNAQRRNAADVFRELGREFGIPGDTTHARRVEPDEGTTSAEARKS
jgi:hypothetical protein